MTTLWVFSPTIPHFHSRCSSSTTTCPCLPASLKTLSHLVLTCLPTAAAWGALGLPGDLSSASRFARVAFTRMNSRSGESESESISQFFHILGSVDQQRGCCEVTDGKYEITLYTSCCNATKGIYYYTTYENHQISAVNMHHENLDADVLIRYPVVTEQNIHFQN